MNASTQTTTTQTAFLATPTLNGAAIPTPSVIKFSDVTFYIKGGFGNVTRVDARELTIETGVKYAQYDFAVRVTYKAGRQRNARSIVLAYNPFFVVVARADAIDP